MVWKCELNQIIQHWAKKRVVSFFVQLFNAFLNHCCFFSAKVKLVTEKIRGMSDADIEKLLSKGENESPLTVIDDVPIESEDVHIVYRVAKQTQYEATAEKGVCFPFASRIFRQFLVVVCCFTGLYS